MSDELTLEDQALLALSAVAGDDPMPLGSFIAEVDIAATIGLPLGVDEAFIRSNAFFHSQERLKLLAALHELDNQGLVKSRGTMGWDAFATTGAGRARARDLRERRRAREERRLREARSRILDELKEATNYTTLDLRKLGRAGITMEVYEAALRDLADDAGVERSDKPAPLLKSEWRLTPAGRAEAGVAADGRPSASDALRLAAKYKRELDLARERPETLIRDSELHRRVTELLTAEGDHDRAVREACVILETRVRAAIGGPPDLVGFSLMDKAFSGPSPKLRLSDVDAEQSGAHQMFRGLMAFHRNAAGHRLLETDAPEALRIVVWVDHLLTLVAKAKKQP